MNLSELNQRKQKPYKHVIESPWNCLFTRLTITLKLERSKLCPKKSEHPEPQAYKNEQNRRNTKHQSDVSETDSENLQEIIAKTSKKMVTTFSSYFYSPICNLQGFWILHATVYIKFQRKWDRKKIKSLHSFSKNFMLLCQLWFWFVYIGYGSIHMSYELFYSLIIKAFDNLFFN